MSTPEQPLSDPTTRVAIDDLGTLTATVATTLAPIFTNNATKMIEQFEQRITTAMEDRHQASLGLIKVVEQTAVQGLADNAQSIQDALGQIGGSLAATIKTSPRIQAVLIVGSVGIVWLGCLATWIAYLAGAPAAQGIIGWAGAAFAASTTVAGILHQLGFLGTTNPTTPALLASPVVAALAAPTPVLAVTPDSVKGSV